MSDVVTHKCPNCDGPLLFDPTTQNFTCEYCHSVFSEKDIEQFEMEQPHNDTILEDDSTVKSQTEDNNDTQSNDHEPVEETPMDLFECPSCGAEIVTDATTAATYCYYCHNPVVLTGRVSGAFLPERILPFAVEKEKAETRFLKWARKKMFVPRDFFSKNQVEKLTGVYFPYWLVDGELQGNLSANANSVSVWRSGDIEYTQTKKYRIYREGAMTFTDLIKNALSKNDKQKMVESVQPFPIDKAIPFNTHYLAGFQAEKRDIEFHSMEEDVHNDMKKYGNKLLHDTISGYSTIYNDQTNITIDKENHQYVLLPVWLLTYRDPKVPEKLYYYAMNGQTGKVSGKLPVTKVKLGLASFGIGCIVCFIGLLVGYLL